MAWVACGNEMRFHIIYFKQLERAFLLINHFNERGGGTLLVEAKIWKAHRKSMWKWNLRPDEAGMVSLPVSLRYT